MKKNKIYTKKPYIIAECAYAYEGEKEYLKEAIKKISNASCADAIKFHVLLDIDTYMCADHDLYEKMQSWSLNKNEWQELVDVANDSGLEVIILADDLGSIPFLRSISEKITAVEIHSVSLNDIKMLEEVSTFKLPIMLGIGGATIDEITFAVNYLERKRKSDIILMYGFQNFPTKYNNINFNKMRKIKEIFGLPIGYADHTSWDDEDRELITIAGFLFGADIVEKHFVLEKGKERVDYQAAVSVSDFKELKDKLAKLEKAIGNGCTDLNEHEKACARIGPIKKALMAERIIEKDEEISLDNIAFKRTAKAGGVLQKDIENLLGKKAKVRIEKNSLIDFNNTY